MSADPPEPNSLERAILLTVAAHYPTLQEDLELHFPKLQVLSREMKGSRCYTRFATPDHTNLEELRLFFPGKVEVPGMKLGLGAVLFCHGGQPTMLEVFPQGEERWNGQFEGFSLA